jgi:hypothetical protein
VKEAGRWGSTTPGRMKTSPKKRKLCSVAMARCALILDYYHAVQADLPALAGELGATYAIPIIYVPLLMITHIVAFYLLLRPRLKAARVIVGDASAS